MTPIDKLTSEEIQKADCEKLLGLKSQVEAHIGYVERNLASLRNSDAKDFSEIKRLEEQLATHTRHLKEIRARLTITQGQIGDLKCEFGDASQTFSPRVQ